MFIVCLSLLCRCYNSFFLLLCTVLNLLFLCWAIKPLLLLKNSGYFTSWVSKQKKFLLTRLLLTIGFWRTTVVGTKLTLLLLFNSKRKYTNERCNPCTMVHQRLLQILRFFTPKQSFQDLKFITAIAAIGKRSVENVWSYNKFLEK